MDPARGHRSPGVDHDTGEILGPEPVPARAPRAVRRFPPRRRPGRPGGGGVAPARAVDAPPLEAAAPGRAAGRRGRRGPGQRAGRPRGRHPPRGRTIGPTVTRFELELGLGVKVARSRPVQGHRLCDGVARRAILHHPGEVGHRRRGAEPPAPARLSRRHPRLRRGRRGRPPARGGARRDIAGRAVLVNLAEMPHVLISGATGAGNPRASTRSSPRSSCGPRPTRCA